MKRFYLAPLVLLVALSTVYLLPDRGRFAQSAIISEAPLSWGEWTGEKTLPSKEETAILDKDTTFNKATYSCYELPDLRNALGQHVDYRINLSIVKSGSNVNNSIHRPERCLLGQGHQDITSTDADLVTPKGHTIKVKQLTSWFPIAPANEGDPPFKIGFLSYYYFVGNKVMCNDHWQRTFVDVKDRLLSGTDQQWSFIMISIPYNISNDAAESQKSRELADKKIRQLLAELTDRLVLWNEIK